MEKLLKLVQFIMFAIFISACATSMTPMQVNDTLPTLTKSEFIPQSQLENNLQSDKCKYLVKGRKYTAPIGFTVNDDLRNGAKGIDEWVILDGGNAYVLTNYRWETVDQNGTTQLIIEFDTLKCE